MVIGAGEINKNKMNLQVGLKFKVFYNDNNLNNIDYCEVRAIVDDKIIVIFCKKQKTKHSEYKEFYDMIEISSFNFLTKQKVYLPL